MKRILAVGTALIMGGCSLQQTNPPVTEYRLKPLSVEKVRDNGNCKETTLRIGLVQASGLLQRQAFYYADDSHRQYLYTKSRWAEAPDKQLQHLFESVVAQTGLFKSVITYISEARNQQLLEVRVTDFMQYFEADGAYVHLDLELSLIEQDSMRILSSRHFDLKKKCPTPDARGAVEALNALVNETLEQTAAWLGSACVKPE